MKERIGFQPFSKRVLEKREHSGVSEVSSQLRFRLDQVIGARLEAQSTREIRRLAGVQISQVLPDISLEAFSRRLNWELGTDKFWKDIVSRGSYDQVLDAVDVFLDEYSRNHPAAHYQMAIALEQVFLFSGSAYCVEKVGRVGLRIAKESLDRLATAERLLNPDARATFSEAVKGLLSRETRPTDVVRDAHVAFESYLKEATGSADHKGAIKRLREGALTGTQVAIVERLYGYRSNSNRVTHSAPEREPDEADALWFLEMVASCVQLVSQRTKRDAKTWPAPKKAVGDLASKAPRP